MIILTINTYVHTVENWILFGPILKVEKKSV